MIRRRELLDLNKKEDYRFALKFLHDSHVRPCNPFIDWLYHSEFGTPEELKKAEEALENAGKYLVM